MGFIKQFWCYHDDEDDDVQHSKTYGFIGLVQSYLFVILIVLKLSHYLFICVILGSSISLMKIYKETIFSKERWI